MVSVIMTTYNRAHLIKESIDSVLNQSYAGLELLIADDGSTDDTDAVLQHISDPRVRYFKLPHTGCTGRMKNILMREATGEYIAFMDSDDLWTKDKLEKQLRLLQAEPSIGFSITNIGSFRGDTITAQKAYTENEGTACINVFDQLKENRFIIYNPTLVIRATCLQQSGWFDDNMPSGDYHFHMRLAYYFNAGILYESLTWRRMHDSNTSEQLPIENYEEFITTFQYLYNHGMVQKKHLWEAERHAFFSMGNLYAQKGNRIKARRNYIASLKINPFQPGCIRRLLLTWLPARR